MNHGFDARRHGYRVLSLQQVRREPSGLVPLRAAQLIEVDQRAAGNQPRPEHRNCGQECLAQIQASPEDCLVRRIFVEWYRGKQCASCGQPFVEVEWSRKPALLGADRVSLEWDDIPVDKLREVLAASEPLCFACYMAGRLVQEHPELVVDRSAR